MIIEIFNIFPHNNRILKCSIYFSIASTSDNYQLSIAYFHFCLFHMHLKYKSHLQTSHFAIANPKKKKKKSHLQ